MVTLRMWMRKAFGTPNTSSATAVPGTAEFIDEISLAIPVPTSREFRAALHNKISDTEDGHGST
jgi:hypothetical protein